MSFKYRLIKRVVRILRFQKIMMQPHERLQKLFKTASAVPKIPKLSDSELIFKVFTIQGQPVLHVKHRKPANAVCVYVVGGGMLKYPKPSQAKEMIKYAKLTGRDMILPYYPLVPKHSLIDVYAMLYNLYKRLLKQYSADSIAFLGGSSGGNHSLGLISYINAKGENLPMPGKIYAASPGTMLLTDEEKRKAAVLEKKDLIMSCKAMDIIFDGMANGKEVPEYMRYLQKGNYMGLKDVYLCFGGDEVFCAAAVSLKMRLEKYGTNVTLEIGEGMFHCYSAMPLVPECRQGYKNMIHYLSI